VRRTSIIVTIRALFVAMLAGLMLPAEADAQRNRDEPPASAMGASWAPDGTSLLFSSDRSGTFQIYRISADGREVEQLTDMEGTHFFYPFFSPDGERITLMSYASEEQAAVWVMNANGSELRRLTPEDGYNAHPRFSPDGERIVFESARDGNSEIYLMNADGTNPRRLTELETKDTAPAFSPDGERIVFAARGLARARLRLMNADGSDLRTLTDEPGTQDLRPAWSPDGKTIAFHGVERIRDPLNPRPGYTCQLFTVNVASGERARLTRGQGFKYEPTYSPDGTRIAFTWDRQNKEVWVMTAEGTRPQRLTRSNRP